MEFIPTDFPGLWLLEPKVFKDDRGFFQESYNQRDFEAHGIGIDFVQDNHARSEQAGVLRGFHFQAPPSAQAKLVRVTRGRVLDVVVDLRQGSPQYGKCFTVELSADNFLELLIPVGFAHAYLTLEPGTEFVYKVDAFYDPDSEGGVLWSDPALKVDWPVKRPILSDKDANLPMLQDFESPFNFS